jgi:hypothetical protein
MTCLQSFTFCFSLLLFTSSCESTTTKISHQKNAVKNTAVFDSAAIDSGYYAIQLQPVGNYENTKKTCNQKRQNLYLKYQSAKTDTAKQKILDEARWTLTENLLNRIFPSWYGTKWAFEGYTAQPGKGEVACGYFVSTTLKHSGFNLDRYRLAQKNPETEACSIQCSDSIERLENISPQEIRSVFMSQKKDGLYFAGLDAHVGFLLKRKGELFFIHSNYIGDGGVTIEKVVFSDAFASSSRYYIACITHNNRLVQAWMAGKEIIVRK